MSSELGQTKIEINSFEELLVHLRARDGDSVEWTPHTTENGTPYAVGVHKADPVDVEQPDIPPAPSIDSELAGPGPPPMRCTYVHWVDGNDSWKDAEKEVQDLGISRYRFYTHWYQPWYELDFHNTKGWEWRFVDQRDRYSVATVLNRDHSLSIWPMGKYRPVIEKVCTP